MGGWADKKDKLGVMGFGGLQRREIEAYLTDAQQAIVARSQYEYSKHWLLYSSAMAVCCKFYIYILTASYFTLTSSSQGDAINIATLTHRDLIDVHSNQSIDN